MSTEPGPRVCAVAVIRHPVTDALFVGEFRLDGLAPFHRPLGGGVRRGERAEEALRRELWEELRAEIVVGPRLAVVENLFEMRGVPGHEVVLVHEATFADDRFLRDIEYPVRDSPGEVAVWRGVAVREDTVPLYPAGLARLVEWP